MMDCCGACLTLWFGKSDNVDFMIANSVFMASWHLDALRKSCFFKGEKSMALLPNLRAATMILLTFIASSLLQYLDQSITSQTSLDLRYHKGQLAELGHLESLFLL